MAPGSIPSSEGHSALARLPEKTTNSCGNLLMRRMQLRSTGQSNQPAGALLASEEDDDDDYDEIEDAELIEGDPEQSEHSEAASGHMRSKSQSAGFCSERSHSSENNRASGQSSGYVANPLVGAPDADDYGESTYHNAAAEFGSHQSKPGSAKELPAKKENRPAELTVASLIESDSVPSGKQNQPETKPVEESASRNEAQKRESVVLSKTSALPSRLVQKKVESKTAHAVVMFKSPPRQQELQRSDSVPTPIPFPICSPSSASMVVMACSPVPQPLKSAATPPATEETQATVMGISPPPAKPRNGLTESNSEASFMTRPGPAADYSVEVQTEARTQEFHTDTLCICAVLIVRYSY